MKIHCELGYQKEQGPPQERAEDRSLNWNNEKKQENLYHLSYSVAVSSSPLKKIKKGEYWF